MHDVVVDSSWTFIAAQDCAEGVSFSIEEHRCERIVMSLGAIVRYQEVLVRLTYRRFWCAICLDEVGQPEECCST